MCKTLLKSLLSICLLAVAAPAFGQQSPCYWSQGNIVKCFPVNGAALSQLTLTTPLGVPYGGMGVNSITQNGFVLGNGTGPVQFTLTVPYASTSGVQAALTTIPTASLAGNFVSTVTASTGGVIAAAPTTGAAVLTSSGTSGGIPYFNNAASATSSAVLAKGAPVIGGGAGGAPTTLTTGGGVLVWNYNTQTPSFGAVNLASAAAVTGQLPYANLNLTGQVLNADINASAAIAYSKLNLTGQILNADVNASAAVAYSKLNLTGQILNADVNASAAVAYSKLNLTGQILNADINNSAQINYGKLNLTGGILNNDISVGAAIAGTKLQAAGNNTPGTLNWYENDVSFTPTLAFTSGNGTGTMSIAHATYSRYGKMVTVEMNVTVTKGTGAGNLRISNLPYTSTADASYQAYGVINNDQASAVYFYTILSSQAFVTVFTNANVASTAAGQSASANFSGTITYRVD